MTSTTVAIVATSDASDACLCVCIFAVNQTYNITDSIQMYIKEIMVYGVEGKWDKKNTNIPVAQEKVKTSNEFK